MDEYTIVSDLHLGSNVCKSESILEFLYYLDTDNLILNGDVFDNMDFRRLKKSHWQILKKLRQIAKNTNLIWISGNHDFECEPIAHLIGATFHFEYLIDDYHDRTILITHGDRFDSIITKRPILTKLADNIYRLIQKFDRYRGNDYYYSSIIKRRSKTFSRCLDKTKANAIECAINFGYDSIIIGHLHKAEHLTAQKNNVEYANCGCWTDKTCNYITINQGNVELKEFVSSLEKAGRK
jgi:UDP-2,3-diacylglucosamine pyrophosphatase LpxH